MSELVRPAPGQGRNSDLGRQQLRACGRLRSGPQLCGGRSTTYLRPGSGRCRPPATPPARREGPAPHLPRARGGRDAGRPPPRSLVASAMHRAMMDTAEGHSEFVAGLAPKRPGLQVAQVMRVGWLATANEAWLLGYRAKVISVA